MHPDILMTIMDEGTRRRIAELLRRTRRQELDDLRTQIAGLRAEVEANRLGSRKKDAQLEERLAGLEADAQALYRAIRGDDTTIVGLPTISPD